LRFLHTADWHLGRLFYRQHLTDDQAEVLKQLTRLIADTRPDALVIAGDIYDRAVPSADAVALLDGFLTTVVRQLGVTVIAIAGNHDSPDRLAFGSRLLAEQRLHVRGEPSAEAEPVVLPDNHGPVLLYPLPYAEPAYVRERLGDESVVDHDTAMAALTGRIRAAHPPGTRSVLVAHAFISGGEASESERPLAIGGSEWVARERFSGFGYVALGHLHRAQRAGADSVRYAGSLMKYSFSEAHHRKSISLVEMNARGECSVETIELKPSRDVRIIRGGLAHLLAGPAPGESAEDYLLAELTDRGALLDPMGRLRQVYPNLMHIDRTEFGGASAGYERRDTSGLTVEELFREFLLQVSGEELTAEEREELEGAVRAVAGGDDE